MKKLADTVANILMVLMAILLVVVVALAAVQVVTRYFIAVQIIWIEEVSIYFVTWMAAFGVPWMWLRRGHIKMDVLSFVLPEKILHILDYLSNLVGVAASVAVIRIGIRAIQVNSGYVLSVIKMDEGLRYYPVLCGGILFLFATVTVLTQMILEDRERRRT